MGNISIVTNREDLGDLSKDGTDHDGLTCDPNDLIIIEAFCGGNSCKFCLKKILKMAEYISNLRLQRGYSGIPWLPKIMSKAYGALL